MLAINEVKTLVGPMSLQHIFHLYGIDLDSDSIVPKTVYSIDPSLDIIVFDKTDMKRKIIQLVYIGNYSGTVYDIVFTNGSRYIFTPDQVLFTDVGVTILTNKVNVLTRLWQHNAEQILGIYSIDVYDGVFPEVNLVLDQDNTLLLSNGVVTQNIITLGR